MPSRGRAVRNMGRRPFHTTLEGSVEALEVGLEEEALEVGLELAHLLEGCLVRVCRGWNLSGQPKIQKERQSVECVAPLMGWHIAADAGRQGSAHQSARRRHGKSTKGRSARESSWKRSNLSVVSAAVAIQLDLNVVPMCNRQLFLSGCRSIVSCTIIGEQWRCILKSILREGQAGRLRP